MGNEKLPDLKLGPRSGMRFQGCDRVDQSVVVYPAQPNNHRTEDQHSNQRLDFAHRQTLEGLGLNHENIEAIFAHADSRELHCALRHLDWEYMLYSPSLAPAKRRHQSYAAIGLV